MLMFCAILYISHVYSVVLVNFLYKFIRILWSEVNGTQHFAVLCFKDPQLHEVVNVNHVINTHRGIVMRGE